MLPMANLPEVDKPNFYAGKALAKQPWVKAPSATSSRDGLGPVFNARSCMACHVNGGRGRVPMSEDKPIFSALVRLSIKTDQGAVPDPVYGGQFQPKSTSLADQLELRGLPEGALERIPPAEGKVTLQWLSKKVSYSDGRQVDLHWPKVQFNSLGYGPMHVDTLYSLRNSPAIHGMGLLENIAEFDILALSDPSDHNQDGISGRVNKVLDIASGKLVIGRFGWKASQPTVKQQTAAAFAGDVGLSSPLFPAQPCTSGQRQCLEEVDGNEWDPASQLSVELPENMLQIATDFTRDLAVPVRRKPVDKQSRERLSAGRSLFHQVACVACHVPSYITQANEQYPQLSKQKIWPYSDLLLHDMGEGLADGRPDALATGREWRTPPLWGIAVSKKVNGNAQYLHDGRAQSLEEAVLWHDGEARASRQAFMSLSQQERDDMLAFVASL